MSSDRVDHSHGAFPATGLHRHGLRRRHRSSFYRKWIRPYRRELKSFFLFCVVVILTYLLWDAVAH